MEFYQQRYHGSFFYSVHEPALHLRYLDTKSIWRVKRQNTARWPVALRLYSRKNTPSPNGRSIVVFGRLMSLGSNRQSQLFRNSCCNPLQSMRSELAIPRTLTGATHRGRSAVIDASEFPPTQERTRRKAAMS